MRHRRPLLLVLLAACSKTDPVPVDTDTDVGLPVDTFVDDTVTPPVDSDTDGEPVIHPTDACQVPTALGLAGVCDLSVGEASASLDHVAPHPLLLQVREAGAGTPGAYNGDGLGHRAIAGFHGYDHTPLADLDPIEIVADGIQPGFTPQLGLQVDLDCRSRDFHLIEVPLERTIDTVAESGGRTRYRLPFDAAVWTASEAIRDGDAVLLEQTTGTGVVPTSLLALLARWPDACIRNVDGGFDDLPHHVVASGVLLTLGSRVTFGQGSLWSINEVVLGDDVHLPPP